ncbi:BIRC6 family protein [Megaselia abdita]
MGEMLKVDGFLDISVNCKNIALHPILNVLLVFDDKNCVTVFDVNSGKVLQSCKISENNEKSITGRFMPLQGKILVHDWKNLGFRSDYNGVLLLDTILQAPIENNDDIIKIELLLSEAVIFQQTLLNLEDGGGVEPSADVYTELSQKIKQAYSNAKKGIKAQKWNTICLELPYSSLKLVVNNVVYQLKRHDRHIPALPIVSAINERLNDLLAGSRLLDLSCKNGNAHKTLMHSEVVRSLTFDKWPHMDYKWALPDQMAQAGFYYQPNVSGEDRAMCFTCNVSLVCWEKTDDPWSEHERHSPSCPFVKGEYTQNVPCAVTYASNPAVSNTIEFDVISSSDFSHYMCTSSNESNEITIWNIERQLKRLHSFPLSEIIKAGVETFKITAMCCLERPNVLKVKSTAINTPINLKLVIAVNAKNNENGEVRNSLVVISVVDKEISESVANSAVVLKGDDEEMMFSDDEDEESKCYFKMDENINYGNDFVNSFKYNNLADKSSGSFNEVSNLNYQQILKKMQEISSSTNQPIEICLNEDNMFSITSTGNADDENNLKATTSETSVSGEAKVNSNELVKIVESIFNVTENKGCFIDRIIACDPFGSQLLVKCQYEDTLLKSTTSSTSSDELMSTDSTESPSAVELFSYNLIVEPGFYNYELITSESFTPSLYPKEICLFSNAASSSSNAAVVDLKRFCCLLSNGKIEIFSVKTLSSLFAVDPFADDPFKTMTYCGNSERLCCCTENGFLVFYSLNDDDSDSSDEHVEEDFDIDEGSCEATTNFGQSETDGASTQTSRAMDCSPSFGFQASPESPITTALIAQKRDLCLSDLKTLYNLTLFDDGLTPYTAEVPSCWYELVQAQKQRRMTPGSLKTGLPDDNQYVKTWRLHNDSTSWDEHIIELNLTKTSYLGHVDLRFSLYQQCPTAPSIQITLLKQNTNSFSFKEKGRPGASTRKKSKQSKLAQKNVDDSVDFSLDNYSSSYPDNPILFEEYLETHNAEILVGPIDLSSCMDLCEQGGLITLTSPKLFKTRSKNFLLHIKTISDPTKEPHGKTRGCDWLHEISITIRSCKQNLQIASERSQRIAMLENMNFLHNLLRILGEQNSTSQEKSIVLDILSWIYEIRLNRFRQPEQQQNNHFGQSSCSSTDNTNNDILSHQKEIVEIINNYLGDILENCLINGDRTMSHKCVKLLLIIFEGVKKLPTHIQSNLKFDVNLKDAMIICFSHLPKTKYSSAVRWFTLLVSSTATFDTHSALSEVCLKLLIDVSKELEGRFDSHYALLGTRYGLYGTPLEPELFDFEFSNSMKIYSASPSLVNLLRSNTGISQGGVVNGSGVAVKNLTLDGVEFRSFPHLIKSKAVSNQIRGMLEVEPLHFTCSAASEATRIESMDNFASSSGSNINMEDILIQAPLQTFTKGEVTESDLKKDIKSISEDMMNNVKNLIANKIACPAANYFLKKKNGKSIGGFKYHNKISDHNNLTFLNNSPLAHSSSSEKFINEIPDLISLPMPGIVIPPSNAGCSGGGNDNIKSTPASTSHYANIPPGPSSINMTGNSSMSDVVLQQYIQRHKNDLEKSNISWQKLLTPPPKQMVLIERINSGARRFVVLDFGSPILLTDLVIPSCDELASMYIDVWCINEEIDSVRLVTSTDIGTKTLILSDLQPPPICRFMKITIIGRYGMSATKCKIPIGSFYGHTVILDTECYGDPLLDHFKHSQSDVTNQIKPLKSLYEDVHCRYSLASTKLIELLNPVLSSEMSNVAHMQAFINRDEEGSSSNTKIVTVFEECILLQHQLNVIRNVISRLERYLSIEPHLEINSDIKNLPRDKLHVFSQSLVEILLHFSIEFGLKNIFSLHQSFNISTANILFKTMVVSGDAHIQLATCSLLVRMCCFQSWWGDFLAEIFCKLFSSQNNQIFAQDRVFFLLTYMGRRSIAMGTCRSVVIDSILKTLTKLLVPISPKFNNQYNYNQSNSGEGTSRNANIENNPELWNKSDLQLITWLLLFLSVCLDDSTDKKDKSSNRWDFMSCESDLTKTRTQNISSACKTYRNFKKRIIQQNKYNSIQPYTDWSKKIYMMQSELPEIFMEITSSGGKSKTKIGKVIPHKINKDLRNTSSIGSSSNTGNTNNSNINEQENTFDKSLKSIKLTKLLTVIRGLISLLLEMDFSCNMDQFLLTCKVIARLVSACRPSVQLSKIITSSQLEQLIRLAVWNDQQQPWAIHAITCLLEDLLDADKNYKDSGDHSSENIDCKVHETMETDDIQQQQSSLTTFNSCQKYTHLPSLIECEDTEMDEIAAEIEILSRCKPKKDANNTAVTLNKNSLNYFCKSVSSAMDSRLEIGLNTNTEINICRLTMSPSLDMYSSLPQIPTNEHINATPELSNWSDSLTNYWSSSEYNSGISTYDMFKNVFDCILMDLNIQNSWIHLENVLQLWLSLNSELSERSYHSRFFSRMDIPKIEIGANAIKGLLSALAWHCDIKSRTWCLSFECLILACNTYLDKLANGAPIEDIPKIENIINDENFEKMLLRFFSGYGMGSNMLTNRCAGPTISKHLHILLMNLQMGSSYSDTCINTQRKMKEITLNIVLQLTQPIVGAIANQQGPLDAQLDLIDELNRIQFDKNDLNVALKLIENVANLTYNNIVNADKVKCQRACDTNGGSNSFGSLFATVLGSDNSKQTHPVSDNAILISLLTLSVSLARTEVSKVSDDKIVCDDFMSSSSQTDEIKMEQGIKEYNKPKCIADSVLLQPTTMNRLLASLSNCTSSSIPISGMNTSPDHSLNCDSETVPDALYSLLLTLTDRGSDQNLIVEPLFMYLESNISSRNVMPKLQISEPFLWYVLKVLEVPGAVKIFTKMGGIHILCQNIVKSNKVIVNLQPGLISLIMQHMTKYSQLKLNNLVTSTSSTSATYASKKTSTSSQIQKTQDGLINFAPFCTISSENTTAQPADVLIQAPIASQRRARTPAWSYMFYPNESWVELVITLPSAILLKEVQIQPHISTLATCPSAVALEISRDYSLGSIPFGQTLSTTGMTCIRLKLAEPEIATSLMLRLYRPKDNGSIGLTQISILGQTIFSSTNTNDMNLKIEDTDSITKTSIGWIRILARCLTVSSVLPDSSLYKEVLKIAAEYPQFIEGCCSLMNVVPIIPNSALQILEVVLLKLGEHSKEMSLFLIKNLLRSTTPQMYSLTNEPVCDLLFELCTKTDEHSLERMEALRDWVNGLCATCATQINTLNPQVGFVKCIASILWKVNTVQGSTLKSDLPKLLTDDIFDICLNLVLRIKEVGNPLRNAFCSLLCSLCSIAPENFTKVLNKLNVNFLHSNDIVSNLLLNPSTLSTIATISQSSEVMCLLVSYEIPKVLAQTVNEFCLSYLPENQKNDMQLTDSDKGYFEKSHVNIKKIPMILDFFAECSGEGYIRDWLGSYQGSIFWKPLLTLLCNYRPVVEGNALCEEEQVFIELERATIKFFTKVTACHPKNQDILTIILIDVIRKPEHIINNNENRPIISGFTRRMVLQLFLESEKILVSIESKIPLEKNNSALIAINKHPSKRVNKNHLLFFLSTQTKCQEIIQNCLEPQENDSNIVKQTKSLIKFRDPSNMEVKLDMSGKGMEFLSVAAGVTAKDKRTKDVANQAAAMKDGSSSCLPRVTKVVSLTPTVFQTNAKHSLRLVTADQANLVLTSDSTIAQILSALGEDPKQLSTPCLNLELVHKKSFPTTSQTSTNPQKRAANMNPLPSPLQIFSSRGGLSLLAHYLPKVYLDNTVNQPMNQSEKEKSPPSNDWVKVEPTDEIYEDLEDTLIEPISKPQSITSVPQHSLAAFGLFLKLPAYSDVLLRDKMRAQCLLRLVLGVTGDGEGNDIYSLAIAPSLPTLPFEVFRQLLDSSPLTTDDGIMLRKMVIEVGALHLVLNCLGVFTHQSNNFQVAEPTEGTSGAKSGSGENSQISSDDKSHMYWAKGTGFGTGSIQQSWNVEQALLKQKSEEEHVTVLLQVLSSYINPYEDISPAMEQDQEIMDCNESNKTKDSNGELPGSVFDLLQKSCLIPALSSYLRNDSVLDITRHIPLYRAILQLLRSISTSHQLIPLLTPKGSDQSPPISELLTNMKHCVDTYAKRLKVNKKSNIKGQTQKVTVNLDDGDDEGLALLIPDIQETAVLVQKATKFDIDCKDGDDAGEGCSKSVEKPLVKTIEERYMEVMKKLQFDTFEMIVESSTTPYKFAISHHYEGSVKLAGDRYHPSRVKRLAQEAVTLSTSLPLSYSSSVFVRCDTDRLDIMKVLITGPADTPYANGCFEFDVFFPPDYPSSPMQINLETTGRHSVRFNPNLYNDGKVCLSVLNTWHGRPEEKWNAQTSSFLQVLVSIQSLILVPEPYFNEPGFERSRGTPSGTHSSREYNSNIYQACVRWAMLEQIRNPNPCFKEVIHTHFWLKRFEICKQIESWIDELSKTQSDRSGRTISFNAMVLRRQYRQLREELGKLQVPKGLQDLDVTPFNPNVTLSETSSNAKSSEPTSSSSLDNHDPKEDTLNNIAASSSSDGISSSGSGSGDGLKEVVDVATVSNSNSLMSELLKVDNVFVLTDSEENAIENAMNANDDIFNDFNGETDPLNDIYSLINEWD